MNYTLTVLEDEAGRQRPKTVRRHLATHRNTYRWWFAQIIREDMRTCRRCITFYWSLADRSPAPLDHLHAPVKLPRSQVTKQSNDHIINVCIQQTFMNSGQITFNGQQTGKRLHTIRYIETDEISQQEKESTEQPNKYKTQCKVCHEKANV